MKALPVALMMASILISADSFAAQAADTAAAKQAARETCLTEAQQKYGSAEVTSRPRRKSIGGMKGYSYKMRVGEKNKKIVCVATVDGEVRFYIGPL